MLVQAGRVEIMKIHGAPITKKGDIGAMPMVARGDVHARSSKTNECLIVANARMLQITSRL